MVFLEKAAEVLGHVKTITLIFFWMAVLLAVILSAFTDFDHRRLVMEELQRWIEAYNSLPLP